MDSFRQAISYPVRSTLDDTFQGGVSTINGLCDRKQNRRWSCFVSEREEGVQCSSPPVCFDSVGQGGFHLVLPQNVGDFRPPFPLYPHFWYCLSAKLGGFCADVLNGCPPNCGYPGKMKRRKSTADLSKDGRKRALLPLCRKQHKHITHARVVGKAISWHAHGTLAKCLGFLKLQCLSQIG